MTARIHTSVLAPLMSVVLIAASVFALSGAARQVAVEAPAMVAPALPYAQVKVIKLSELLPAQPDAPDVYVRVIAIDGDILLSAHGQ